MNSSCVRLNNTFAAPIGLSTYECAFPFTWFQKLIYAILIPPIGLFGLVFTLCLFFILCLVRNKFPLSVHDFPAMVTKCIFSAILFFRFIVHPILNAIPTVDVYSLFFTILDLYCLAMYALPSVIKLYRISIVYWKHRLKLRYHLLEIKFDENEFMLQQKKRRLLQQIKFIDQWGLKYFISVLAMILGLIMVYIALFFIIFIIINIAVFNNSLTTVITYVYVIVGVIIGFISIGLLIIAIIAALALRVKDPYRIFTMASLSVFTFSLVLLFLILFLTLLMVSNVIGRTMSAQVVNAISSIVLIFLLIFAMIDLFVAIGLPILQALFWKRKSSDKSTSFDLLHQILHDKKGMELFRKYCQLEWSAENVDYWREYQLYLQSSTLEQKIHLAQNLYVNYIDSTGAFALNLENTTRNQCEAKYRNADELDQMLQVVKNQVEINMCDTLSRFVRSDEYLGWRMEQTSHEQISKDLGWSKTEE